MVTGNTKLYSKPFEDGVISYYLTESKIATEEGAFTRFGARIEKSGGEHAQALDIFGDRRKASMFIQELADGLVTPVTLLDIVCDRLYAEEFSCL